MSNKNNKKNQSLLNIQQLNILKNSSYGFLSKPVINNEDSEKILKNEIDRNINILNDMHPAGVEPAYQKL